MTVALLDVVTIHWLLCIDPRLIGIVKTEFASELKTSRLSQMVKTIAKSIDELLLRYGSKDQINFVEAPPTKTKTSAHDAVPDRNIVDLVNRIDRLETNFKRQNKKQSNWSKKKRELCSHCLFLNKELGSTLKTDHPSHLCTCVGRRMSL